MKLWGVVTDDGLSNQRPIGRSDRINEVANDSEQQLRDQFEQWNEFNSELVIGLVGAVGTELRRMAEELAAQLGTAGYEVETIQVSELVMPKNGAVAVFRKHVSGTQIRQLSLKTLEFSAIQNTNVT